MTAINALAEKSGCYFLSDTAGYDSAGKVLGWGTKVLTIPRLGVAFGASGFARNVRLLQTKLEEVSTYPELIERFSDLLYEVRTSSKFYEDESDPSQSGLAVIIGGWNADKRCGEVFRCSTSNFLGMTAYEMYPNSLVASLSLSRDAMRQAGLMLPSGEVDWTDPVDALTRMIKAQRADKWPMPDGSDGYFVGGEAELTVIDETGIHQRVVLRWPDKLNEMIDPTAAAVDVVSKTSATIDFTGLSRLQRERMQKKIAKGTLRTAV